jgi:hypothetical protein
MTPFAAGTVHRSRFHAAAVALMEADLNQNLRVDSGQPLAFHQLIQVGESHWYWYQRYHHLVVDGFSFPAITRQIAAIYAAWKKGEPRRNPRLRHLLRWWTSISAIATARRISATAPSGQSSASSFLLRSRSLPRRCRARRHDRYSAPENYRRRPRL